MAATCKITGTILNGDGTANTDVQIRAKVRSTEEDKGGQLAGQIGVTSVAIEAFTEDDGSFEIELIQGGVFLLEIPDINLRKEITVPAETTVDFSTLV